MNKLISSIIRHVVMCAGGFQISCGYTVSKTGPASVNTQYETIREVNITAHPANDRHPSWSPDGAQLVFESDRNGKWSVYVINKDGTACRALVSNEFNNRMPSFHPDGESVLFESDKTGKFELYQYHMRSEKITKVLLENEFRGPQTFGVFSPDCNYLAFCSESENKKDNYNIYTFMLKSRQIFQMTYDTTRSLYPSWSPNSKEIVFFSRRDTGGKDDELYRLNIQNGNMERLTDDLHHNFCPTWTAGGFIVYSQAIEKTRPELFMMHSVTKATVRLTLNDETDTEPSVSPDGKSITWTGYRDGNFEIIVAELPISDK